MASTKFLTIVFMFLQGIFHQTDAALTFSSANTASVAENTAAETEIIQVVAAGGTAPYAYTIAVAPAAIASWVEIVANTDKLRIATGATIDFENSDLVGASSALTITITATDSAGTPDTGDQTFTLTVTNVEEAPEFTLSSLAVKLATAAAGTTLFTIVATDPENAGAVTYGLAATSDAHVEISGADISVKTGVTLTDCVKVIAVKATDAASNVGSDYAAACIGLCTASCDGSGAGAITGNGLGILTALVVLMVLCDRFH